MKMINTVTVLDTELEVAASRAGTKCAWCHLPVEGTDYVRVPRTPAQPNGVHLHAECFKMRPYGYFDGKPYNYLGEDAGRCEGKAGKNQWTLTLELEQDAGVYMSSEKLAYVLGAFGVQCGLDCTVTCEGHMRTIVNFHGFKEWLKGLQALPYWDMTPDSCGMHVNVGRRNWDEDTLDVLYSNRAALYNPLTAYLYSHPYDTKLVFGRFFGGWAEDYITRAHESYINHHKTWIEYRLPHFVNETQMLWCCQMLVDFNEQLNRFVEGKQTAPKTGEKLVRIFQKYAAGKADIQKPARNSGLTFHENIRRW